MNVSGDGVLLDGEIAQGLGPRATEREGAQARPAPGVSCPLNVSYREMKPGKTRTVTVCEHCDVVHQSGAWTRCPRVKARAEQCPRPSPLHIYCCAREYNGADLERLGYRSRFEHCERYAGRRTSRIVAPRSCLRCATCSSHLNRASFGVRRTAGEGTAGLAGARVRGEHKCEIRQVRAYLTRRCRKLVAQADRPLRLSAADMRLHLAERAARLASDRSRRLTPGQASSFHWPQGSKCSATPTTSGSSGVHRPARASRRGRDERREAFSLVSVGPED
jgi:hypothetical protein